MTGPSYIGCVGIIKSFVVLHLVGSVHNKQQVGVLYIKICYKINTQIYKTGKKGACMYASNMLDNKAKR